MILRRMKLLLAAAIVLGSPALAGAAELKIAIVQAQAGDARTYKPLLDYLATHGMRPSFVAAPDYRAAADMFARGSVDAMFGGSGIAGTMIIKGLARPVVHAVGSDGIGTYRAVVVAPKGSAGFAGTPDYFDGKRVIFAALASAGEFYFHAAGRSRPAATLKAASHGAAIDALARGQADVAVVKNHVWTKERSKFPMLEQVGADVGDNPDGSLIVSVRLPAETVRKVSTALLALEGDTSPSAVAARQSLKIKGYAPAGDAEFAHTVALLRKAGVDEEFAFAF